MNFEDEVRTAQHLNFVDRDTSDFLIGSELDFDDEQHLLWTKFEKPYFTELGVQIIIDDVIENYPDWDARLELDNQGTPTGRVFRTAMSFRHEWNGMIRTTAARLRGLYSGLSQRNTKLAIHQIPILFQKAPEVWLTEQKNSTKIKGTYEEDYLDRQWNKLRFIYVFFHLYITKYMPKLIKSHNRADDDLGSIVYDILYEFRLLIDRISYWNYFPWEVLLLTDTIDSILLAMNNVNNKIGMMRTKVEFQNYTTTDPDFHLLSQMAVAGSYDRDIYTFQILQLYFSGSFTDRNYFTQGVNAAGFDLTLICNQLEGIQGERGTPGHYFPSTDGVYPQNLSLEDNHQALSFIFPNSSLNTESLITQSVFQIMFSSNGIPLSDLIEVVPDLDRFIGMIMDQDLQTLDNLSRNPNLDYIRSVFPTPLSEISDSGDSQMSVDETQEQTPYETPEGQGSGSSSAKTRRLSPEQEQRGLVQRILNRFNYTQYMISPQRPNIMMIEVAPAMGVGTGTILWVNINDGLVYNNAKLNPEGLVGNVSSAIQGRTLFPPRSGGSRKKKTKRRRKKKTKRRRKKKKKTRRKNKKKRRKKTKRRRKKKKKTRRRR